MYAKEAVQQILEAKDFLAVAPNTKNHCLASERLCVWARLCICLPGWEGMLAARKEGELTSSPSHCPKWLHFLTWDSLSLNLDGFDINYFFLKGDTDVGKMKLDILLKCKIMRQHRIPWLHLLPKTQSPEAKEISLYLVFFHFPRHFCVWPSSAWGQARPTYFRLFEFMDYDYNTPKGQEFWIWVSLPIFRKALPSSLFTSWGERIPL